LRRLISLFFIFVLIPGICNAATIYLDIAATGCAGGGQANTNYNPATRSCASGSAKVFAGNYPYEAGKALGDGDTLYIRAGEYYENVTGKPGYAWYWGSMYISASNVTITPYNNEVVWLKGGVSSTTPANYPNNALAFYGNNIVINGLYIYGGTIFMGTNNIMQNCDLSGGWDHQDPIWNTAQPDSVWPNVIRFYGSVNAVVYSCRLHDNVRPPSGGNEGNMALIMHDEDDNTTVENCEFYNPTAGGDWSYLKYQSGYNGSTFKGTGTHATYRYNVFRGSGGGIDLVAGKPDAPNPVQKEIFYQNIFINCKAGFLDTFVQSGTLFAYIYNNVFYNVPYALYNWASMDVYNFFNNIVYNSINGDYNFAFDSPVSQLVSYINYNDYYTVSGVTAKWYLNGTYSSLSAWQSYTAGQGYAKDANSLNSNPNFTNASGTFSQASDFRRTSYPANGRGGSWYSVMGAYISGNEIIGVNTGALPPPPSSKRPNPPTNLRVI
jgi:hypothetical protein